MSVCVQGGSGSAARLQITTFRLGSATTSTFSDPGDQTYRFLTTFSADVTASGPVFENGTLHLERLPQSGDASCSVQSEVSVLGDDWYDAVLSGAGSFSFNGF